MLGNLTESTGTQYIALTVKFLQFWTNMPAQWWHLVRKGWDPKMHRAIWCSPLPSLPFSHFFTEVESRNQIAVFTWTCWGIAVLVFCCRAGTVWTRAELGWIRASSRSWLSPYATGLWADWPGAKCGPFSMCWKISIYFDFEIQSHFHLLWELHQEGVGSENVDLGFETSEPGRALRVCKTRLQA